MTEIDLDAVCGATLLAKLFGTQVRRVQELGASGVLPKEGRNEYRLLESVTAFVAYLRERHATHPRDLNLEKARLTKAQADRAEIELAKARGELIPANDVAKTWGDLVLAAKARLNAIPTSAAPTVHAADSTTEVTRILALQIEEALDELASSGIPDGYDEALERDDEVMEATATAHG